MLKLIIKVRLSFIYRVTTAMIQNILMCQYDKPRNGLTALHVKPKLI